MIFFLYILVNCLKCQCPFSSFEEGLLPSTDNYKKITKKIQLNNLEKESFCIGFWTYPQVTFDQTLFGQFFFKIQNKTMMLAAVLKMDEEFQTNLQFNIGSGGSHNFIYQFNQYLNQWIFTLITITNQLNTIIIEMTGQQKFQVDMKLFELDYQYDFIIGIDYLIPGRANKFIGRLSLPIFFQNILYSSDTFKNIQVICKIPNLVDGLQTTQIVSGMINFQGQQIIQFPFFQYGRKYCLYGWAKYNSEDLITQTAFVYIRLSQNQNKSYKKVFGDELFKLQGHLYKHFPPNSKIKVIIDANCKLTYSTDDLCQTDASSNIDSIFTFYSFQFYNVLDDSFTQGLQQWHFFQYEYGRESQEGIEMLFQMQFYNSIGQIQRKLINKSQGSWVNGQMYAFIGEKDSVFDYLYAKLCNINILSNYEIDQEYLLSCHAKCKTCNGPLESNCLSCYENQNRVLNFKQQICSCQDGYGDNLGNINCLLITEEFQSIKSFQVPKEAFTDCLLGEYLSPISENNFQCLQCPQKTQKQILCGDCWLNSKSWYLNPICSFDFLSRDKFQDDGYILTSRKEENIDLYIIDENYRLVQMKGFAQFCDKNDLDDKCHLVNYFHMKQQISVICKPNFQFLNNDCIQKNYECNSYGTENNCLTCLSNQYLRNGRCLQCPDKCEKCSVAANQQVQCDQCQNRYGFLNGQCQRCGTYCLKCQQDISSNGNIKYLKCQKCIDDSDYFLLLDGRNCAKNFIKGCQYVIQFHGQNYGGLVYDNYKSDIVTVCGYCKIYSIYNQQTKACEVDPIGLIMPSQYYSNYNCLFSIITNSNQCILSENYIGSILIPGEMSQFANTWTLQCSIYVENCKVCQQVLNYKKYQCLTCNLGYYADRLSGQCYPCPQALQCLFCGQQQIISQDYWVVYLRPFIKLFLEIETVYEFSKNSQSQNPQDYEIICLGCQQNFTLVNGKCIPSCPDSCEECELIENEFKCVRCQLKNQKRQLSIIDNSCNECPTYCSLCRKRTVQEIYNINPQFSDNNFIQFTYQCLKGLDEQINYYDSFLGRFLKCDNGGSCKNELVIELYLTCQNVQNQQTVDEQYISATDLFSSTSFSQFENNQFYNLANQQCISHLIIKIKTKQELICNLNQFSAINQQFSNHIFSLITTELQFDFDYRVQFQNWKEISIKDFNLIYFNNISFIPDDTGDQKKLNFQSIYQQTILLQNIDFEQQSSSINPAVIIFTNVSQANLINMTIQNFKQSLQNFTFYFGKNSQQQIIKITNFQILRSQISNYFFFLFELNQEDQVHLSNFIIDSTFENTLFVGQNISSLNSYDNNNIKLAHLGSITMSNIKFKNTVLNTQGFFSLQTFSEVVLQTILINHSLCINSSIIRLNPNIKVFDLKVQLSKIWQSSIILSNSDITNNKTLNFQFQNITFQDNIYDPSIYFINLRKQNSLNQNIVFDMLNLINNNGTNLQKTFIDYEKSLIYIEAQNILIQRFNLLKSYGVTELFIKEAEIFSLIDSYLGFGEQFRFQSLHQSLNCLQNMIITQSFVQVMAIYSTKYVLIKDTKIESLEIFNFPVISFQSAEQQLKLQDETFIMENVRIINNLLVQTQDTLAISIINIKSQQRTTINFNQIIFSQNILHYYEQNFLSTSSLLLNVDCSKCEMTITNSVFHSNIVTNSTDSIISIRSKLIIIQNCLFESNSLFNYQLLQPYLIWGYYNQNIYLENLEEIFPIKSISGNGILIGETLRIINTSVSYSSGQLGGGFQLAASGNSVIELFNNSFFEIKTLFSQQIEQGGIFNIDGTSSQSLVLKVEKLTAKNIFCKYQGGLIYLQCGNQNVKIQIKNLQLKDIFSEQGSFVYFLFQSLSTQKQKILLEDIEIINSSEGYEKFLKNFNVFLQEDQKLLINNRTMIFIEYGSVLMFNGLSFVQIQEESIFELNGFQQVMFQDIKAFYSSFNIFFIKLFPLEATSFIVMNRILLQNISRTQQKQNEYICFQKLSELPQNQYLCQSFFQIAPLQIQEYQSEEKRLAYQQKCLAQNQNSTKQLVTESLILIIGLKITSNIHLTEVIFDSIICDECQEGLLFLQFTESENLVLQKIEVNNFIIKNSNCGLKGCQSFQKISPYASQASSFRLLQNPLFQLIGYELHLKNLLCQNNQAKFGTCAFISNINTLIESSFFTKNNASQFGGAIYISGGSPLILLQCLIKQNQAQIGGGLYFEGEHQINYTKLNNKIEENSASLFGDNFKVLPNKIKVQIRQDISIYTKLIVKSDDEEIEEAFINGRLEQIFLPSGQEINKYQIFKSDTKKYLNANLILRLKALQFDDNLIKNLQNSSCDIQSRVLNISDSDKNQEFTNNYTSLKNINFNSITQDYNLDSMVIYFDSDLPDDIVLQLEFQCNSIVIPVYEDVFPYKLKKSHSNYKLRVNIKTFPCQYGEIKNQTDNSCHICDSNQGFFSLKLNQQQCELKDEVTTISVMPALLQIRKGFWRPYFQTSYISSCQNFPDNCLGGWIEGDASCIIGHLGALCEQCDIYNIRGSGNFAMSEKYQCGSCTDQTKNVIIIILTLLWTLATLFFSVSGNQKMLDEFLKPKLGYKSKLASNLNKSQTGALMKMLTNYFQIVSSLTTFQLSIPVSIESFLNIVGNPIQTTANSQDCFLIDYFSMQIQYSRTLWLLIMPLIYLGAFLFLYLITARLKIIAFNSSMISTSIIHIFLYFQPNIIGSLMQLLSFRTISGFRWIKANVSARYDTDQHYLWMTQFALPFLLILAVIIPLLFFTILYKNKDKLEQKEVRTILGYIYYEYKINTYYWEIVKVLIKQFIIIFLNFYEEDIVIKGVLVLMITFMYQELNQSYKPYQFNNLNYLDYSSTLVCTLSIGLAIGLYVSLQSNLQELQIPFFIILSFFNLRFLFNILQALVLQYLRNFSSTIDNVIELAQQKIPFLTNIKLINNFIQKRKQKQIRTKDLYVKLHQYLIPLAKQSLIYRQLLSQQQNNNAKQNLQALTKLTSSNSKLKSSNENNIVTVTNLNYRQISEIDEKS